MLKVTAVSKSFFSNKVLDSVDIDVLGGEVHGLVGENGAGKSTLINIIGGILQRDSGARLFLTAGGQFRPSSRSDSRGHQRRPSGAQSRSKCDGRRKHVLAAREDERLGA